MRTQNVTSTGQIKLLCAFSAACAFGLPSSTLAEVGLVAAYTFSEGSGTTVADVSGNNNTGTLGGGVTWSAQGKVGNSLAFNGGSFVTVPHSASLNLTTGMTLEAWVFPTSTSTSSPEVILKEHSSGLTRVYGFGVGSSSNGPDAFLLDTTGIPRGINAPPSLPLNAWAHLAATYDAATSMLNIYVNGVLRMSQGVFAGSIATSNFPLRIGGNNVGPGTYFQGRLDEVRIYNRALSQGEIQTDMNTPVGPPTLDTTPPTAATGLTATAVSTSQINLAWSPATDNVGVTGYRVERCQAAGCTTFTQIATSSGTSFSNTGLTPATSYSYRVRATDAAGNAGAYSNTASATPPATDTTPPTAPPGLTATPVGSSQINLSWTASTDNLGVTGYRVERCQGAGCTTFAQIATPSPTSYSDFGLAASTSYGYRVRAVDAAGNLGAYSVVSVTTPAAETTPPTAPSGLTATAVNGQRIDLSWTASTDNVGVDLYFVERCQGASCTNFAQILSSVPTTFSDSTVSAAKTYRYRVRARDLSGNLGAYSNIASATTPTDATPPTAPSGLTATAVSSSQINLSWAASTDNIGVDIYEVYRCQGASCTNFVLFANPRVTSTVDTGLTAATTYRYKVRAKDVALNASPYSSIVSVTTQAVDTAPPSAPSGLTGSSTSNQVNLSWIASTDNVGVTEYRVERCQGAGCTTYAQVGSSTIVSSSDTGLALATSYRYRVRAVDAAGNLGAYSNITSVTTQAAPDTTAPTAPTNLTATTASSSQINLNWTASTDDVGVTSYRVERCQSTGCTTFVQVATPTGTTFSDTGLTAATAYSYRVRATDAAGNLSSYSNIATTATTNAQVQAYYIHPDHLDTPRLIADSTGTTVWRWDQGEPFGNDVPNNNPGGAGAFDFPLRFPGQYFDRETSLAYNYFRDYDPAIGGYKQSDPLGLKAGLNTYLYVAANPLSFADPQGLQLLEKLLKDLTTKGTGDLTSGKATAPARGGEIGKKICTNSGGGLIRDPDRSCRADCLEKLDMSQGTGASGWLEDCVKACTDTLKQCKRPPSGCFGDGDGNRS